MVIDMGSIILFSILFAYKNINGIARYDTVEMENMQDQ